MTGRLKPLAGRLAAAALIALSLAGCVLESREPIFRESDGELALGTGPAAFIGWTLEKDGWKRQDSDKAMTVTPAGKAYVVRIPNEDGKDTGQGEAIFVKLADGQYVVQVRDPKSAETDYALARLDHGTVFLRLLSCTSLKGKQLPGGVIDFQTYSCGARDVTDPRAFFLAMRDLTAEELKLVPAP